MKRITLPTLLFISLMACQPVNEPKQPGKSYKTPETTLASDIMTPEVR